MSTYKIRRALDKSDANKINTLFNNVFHPEEVGKLAEILFRFFPGMKNENWYLAEEESSGKLVSGFTLIPWEWLFENINLRVAEMGIVGTLEEHRGKGLMNRLNKEFDQTLDKESFDIAVIQGIPGFYQQFGYCWATPLENHINLALQLIAEPEKYSSYTIRKATKSDIPFLQEENLRNKMHYSISVNRSVEKWNFLLKESLETEYGSEFWVVENPKLKEKCYYRISLFGFGTGLIISEASEQISYNTIQAILAHAKNLACDRKKPYIRINMHNESALGKYAIIIGAKAGQPYAWQIKIPSKVRLLRKIAPILEKRLSNSPYANFSGILRLDFYKSKIDLIWKNGCLESLLENQKNECQFTFCISNDLFPALCLGGHSWQELQQTRPDIFPELQHIKPVTESSSDITGSLIDVLFPKTKSWVYCQY